MKEKLLIAFFFIAVFVNFLGPIVDPDFPFHLKTGEYIYLNKDIPEDDPFSFYGKGISTDRERFILAQYWISQVIFYKLYSIAGPAGIILLRATVFTAFIFLLWRSLRNRGIYSSLIISSAVIIIFQTVKLDRPQFFSFFFALALIALIEKYREKPGYAVPLYFIPPLMLLWANMHGGFVYGLVVIVIYSVGEACKYFINIPLFQGKRLGEKQVLLLAITALLAVLFTYLNPVFNSQILETFQSHSEMNWLYSDIREYVSPVKEMGIYFGQRIPAVIFFFIFGFVIAITIFNTLRTKSLDITVFFLIVFASIAALSAVRYIPFFLATALPLTRNYRFFSETDFLKKLRGAPAMTAVYAFLLIPIIFSIVFGVNRYPKMFSFDKTQYPERAADFLLSNRMNTNIFSHFNKGSYLLWRLYPHYKVFSDTRFISFEAVRDADAMTYAVRDYRQPFNLSLADALSTFVPKELGEINISAAEYASNAQINKPLWKRLLEQYDINLIVHEVCGPFTKELHPLILRLVKDDEWALIYLDGTFSIFVRNKEQYFDIIERFKKPKEIIYDSIIFQTIPLAAKKVPISTPYSSLAFALMMKGDHEKARIMIDAALELDEKDVVAHFLEAYSALNEKKK